MEATSATCTFDRYHRRFTAAFPVKCRFYLRLPFTINDEDRTHEPQRILQQKNSRVVDDNIQSDLVTILCVFFFYNGGHFYIILLEFFILRYHKISNIKCCKIYRMFFAKKLFFKL